MIRPTTISSGVVLFSALLNASITTTTTLTSVMPAAPVFGQTVTLIATVSPTTAPGFVSFVDRGVLVGTGAVNGSGVAQSATLTLSAGPHSLVAIYGGNTSGGYLASQSAPRSYVVTSAPGTGFAAAVNYAGGSAPWGMALGDFNGDGKADMAVPNLATGNVSVLLGNGNGTFQAAVNYQTWAGCNCGVEPIYVAVGDFNADGEADLAVANYNSGTVGVLLGNGNGTFRAAVNYATGTFPRFVGVGDFNGDGKADLVLANYGAEEVSGTGSVSILLGSGDGTFQAASNSALTNNPFSVAIGDFNGDGKTDLAVASSTPIGGNITVLLGNGDGSFHSGVDYSVSGATYIVAGDFNRDGKTDLAVTNYTGNAYKVGVLIGNGDGTFLAVVNYADAYGGGYPLAVGDFNGDGILDLTVGGAGALLGNGDGTFQTGVSTGLTSGAVAVGDFNGDGVEDLAAAESGVNISLGIGTAPPAATTTTLLTSPDPSHYGQQVTLTAQVSPSNAPGKVEFLDGTSVVGAGTLVSGQAQSDTLSLPSGTLTLHAVYSGVPHFWQPSQSGVVSQAVSAVSASGGFGAAASYAAGTNPQFVAVGDFNGDGKADLVVVDYGGGGGVLLGNSDGTFQAAVNFSVGSFPTSVAVGDFNGDGKADIAVANSGFSPNYTPSVSVLLGKGDGTFSGGGSYSAGEGPTSVAVGDFNGDGKEDLVVANSGNAYYNDMGTVVVLLGNGDGTFQSGVSSAAGNGPFFVAVGDFNGDGIADVAVANQSSYDLSVLLGKGDGTFQAAVSYASGTVSNSVAVGDFNGDGKADLVFPSGAVDVGVLLGNGNGTFQAVVFYNVDLLPDSVAVGDFNGDGRPDLAVTNSQGNDVSVLLGNGDGTFRTAANYGVGTKPQSVAVGDFNGDGAPDLAVANFTSNNVSILLGRPTPVVPLQFYPIAPCHHR
jgi:hypothetical protein